MANQELSKHIQNMDTEPNLQIVINKVRHAEIVEANQGALKPLHLAPEVHSMNRNTKYYRIAPKQLSNKSAVPENKNTPGKRNSCRKCGRSPKHKFSECAAIKAICKRCGSKGHWKFCYENRRTSRTRRNSPHWNLPKQMIQKTTSFQRSHAKYLKFLQT